MLTRIIPVLLLDQGGLIKTVKFKDETYIGDPINAVRIFNELEVDEIIVLDVGVSKGNLLPDYTLIKELAEEAFMPFCYGGGIVNTDIAAKIFQIGVEKVSINSALYSNAALLEDCAKKFGSQSIVVSIDIKKGLLGQHYLYNHVSGKVVRKNLLDAVRHYEMLGMGELLLNSVDLDGSMAGYDLKLISEIVGSTSVPVVACGGAGKVHDMKQAIDAGANAAAAGSIFVYQGSQKGILINYPDQGQIEEIFKD